MCQHKNFGQKFLCWHMFGKFLCHPMSFIANFSETPIATPSTPCTIDGVSESLANQFFVMSSSCQRHSKWCRALWVQCLKNFSSSSMSVEMKPVAQRVLLWASNEWMAFNLPCVDCWLEETDHSFIAEPMKRMDPRTELMFSLNHLQK